MTAPSTPPTAHPRASKRPGLAACLLLCLLAAGVNAQTVPMPAPAARPGPAKAAAPANTAGPAWTELNPAQREILQPLAPSWPTLSQGQKRKWLQMTTSYPSLTPEEQIKMQSRMREWVALSPQQRAQARLNFAKAKELSKTLSAEEKKAKWEAYQSLSDEEKRKLAAKAPPRPAGAAPAARPVAPQKLATVPSRADKPKPKSRPAPRIESVQPTTSQAGLQAPAAPALAPPRP